MGTSKAIPLIAAAFPPIRCPTDISDNSKRNTSTMPPHTERKTAPKDRLDGTDMRPLPGKIFENTTSYYSR